MSAGQLSVPPLAGGNAQFTTTHWSVVLAAGASLTPERQRAIDALYRSYWYPLYAFVRRAGHGIEDAKDLVQSFFARLLEKDYFVAANPKRGRFRNFLLTSLKHFLANERRSPTRRERAYAGLSPSARLRRRMASAALAISRWIRCSIKKVLI